MSSVVPAVPGNNPRISIAYQKLLREKSRLLNSLLDEAGWHSPYRDDQGKLRLPAIDEPLEALRPLALKVIKEPALSRKDVLTKLMTLTIMCPDLTDVHQALAALMGTENRHRAIACLDDCLAQKPQGAAIIAEIRKELMEAQS